MILSATLGDRRAFLAAFPFNLPDMCTDGVHCRRQLQGIVGHHSPGKKWGVCYRCSARRSSYTLIREKPSTAMTPRSPKMRCSDPLIEEHNSRLLGPSEVSFLSHRQAIPHGVHGALAVENFGSGLDPVDPVDVLTFPPPDPPIRPGNPTRPQG
jgi:hypothetical protein